MYDLTGFQRDLLYVAAGQDEPHGLAIKDQLDEYYETDIHHGRLYPNLDTLAEAILIVNMWIGWVEIIPVLVFARSLLYGLDP